MNQQISSNRAIFNKVFFGFSLKMIGKKVSIYVSIFVYFLIIAAYTIIVPMLADKAPIDLFNMATSAMFLMFAVSVVSCYIAIEIFRTGIDDGTELLTVSKPISRKEIVTVKLIVFLIYILIISLVSLIISSFTYLNELSSAQDSFNIMMGIFVGTLVSGIIFGSIATILSIYAKKISAMLITIGISFILMLVSMLMSFVITTPVQYIQDSGKSLVSINNVNYDKDKKSINFNQGVVAVDSKNSTSVSGGYLDPEAVWNEANQKSGYNKIVNFDFGYQISSIFTLSSVNTDLDKVLKMLTALNQPVNLNFSSYNLDNISSIPYVNNSLTPNVPINSNLFLTNSGSSTITNTGATTMNSYNTRVTYTNKEIEALSSEVAATVNEVRDQTSNAITSYDVKYWSDNWYNYGNDSTGAKTDDASVFLSNFFDHYDDEFKSGTLSIGKLIKEINKIQYGAYLSLYYNGTLNKLESNALTNEQKVQLELLGLTVDQTTGVYLPTGFNAFSINSIAGKFRISNPFTLVDQNLMSYAKMVSVEPVMKSEVLIPAWVAVAVVIFIVAIALYFRRDFA